MTIAAPALLREADEILPGVVADRRYFHEHPELGFQEFETARIVAERLRGLGFDDVQTGIATTGVVGILHGSKPGKVVALRADMDALPIFEENDVEYRSQTDGVMHACGHDAHTAILLGVARVLAGKRDEFSGTIKFLFQPAEEGGGGARTMVQEGVLENPAVDAAFGLHVASLLPSGLIQTRDGVQLAGADGFKIVVTGKGGHGAQPHLTIDPIVAGTRIVSALQTIVSRNVDPILAGVVTVGSFHSGSAGNVIPNTAEMTGTTRSVTPEQREMMNRRVREIAVGVGKALNAEVEVTFGAGAGPTVNTPEMAQLVRAVAAEIVGPERVLTGDMISASEDFGEFTQRVPGAFFFLGTRNEAKGFTASHHHPQFDIDEDPMAIGVAMMAAVALRFLQQ
ncbi:MAG: M20 metallopeptidase family protein [Thermomicrobiales bacterium]